MKKLIKNYTTEIPIEKTIAELQQLLVANGARAIATEYDESGTIKDIFFRIAVENKELPFRLPAKPAKVYTVLHGPQPSHMRQRYGKQWHGEAERIAWRICKFWLEAQITLINLEQATMEEVFLPYLVVGKKNESLYEVIKAKQFLLPDGNT